MIKNPEESGHYIIEDSSGERSVAWFTDDGYWHLIGDEDEYCDYELGLVGWEKIELVFTSVQK